MTRNIRTEWTPSAKNAGRAYGAILTGIGMAFNQRPREMICKMICENVRRRIDIRFLTRTIYFGITRDGEILMGLYSNNAPAPVTEYNLMTDPNILNARGGWIDGVERLVRKLIQQASTEDDSFEKTIESFQWPHVLPGFFDDLYCLSLDELYGDSDSEDDDTFDWDQCHSMLGV